MPVKLKLIDIGVINMNTGNLVKCKYVLRKPDFGKLTSETQMLE